MGLGIRPVIPSVRAVHPRLVQPKPLFDPSDDIDMEMGVRIVRCDVIRQVPIGIGSRDDIGKLRVRGKRSGQGDAEVGIGRGAVAEGQCLRVKPAAEEVAARRRCTAGVPSLAVMNAPLAVSLIEPTLTLMPEPNVAVDDPENADVKGLREVWSDDVVDHRHLAGIGRAQPADFDEVRRGRGQRGCGALEACKGEGSDVSADRLTEGGDVAPIFAAEGAFGTGMSEADGGTGSVNPARGAGPKSAPAGGGASAGKPRSHPPWP